MSNSFLLKGADGRACGYLIVRSGEVCCRISAVETGRILMLNTDVGTTAFHLAENDGEQHFAFPGGEIAYAQVYIGDRLICATDWRAAQNIRMISAKEPEKAQTDEKQGDTMPEKQKAEPDAQHVHGHVWPERRWPPPPCCPGAAYAKGRWLVEL